uniref:Vesicle transport protein n=1 Tax=Trypanosoma congolense (strain IL3000) TaxID=1068625 RepID=G0UQU9_TRYCI|nr:conserved hypothetical protein [Trypanosoma congolense IL3000]
MAVLTEFAKVIVPDTKIPTTLSSNNVEDGEGEADIGCPSLTWKQRIIGCCVCIAIGSLLSLLSFTAIMSLDMVTFGVIYSLGNVASISSTLFLAGPKTQMQRMFSEGRWLATTVFVLSMISTILVAVLLGSALLVLLLCVVQFLAMMWYVLSYIPFARTAVKNCFQGMV